MNLRDLLIDLKSWTKETVFISIKICAKFLQIRESKQTEIAIFIDFCDAKEGKKFFWKLSNKSVIAGKSERVTVDDFSFSYVVLRKIIYLSLLGKKFL